MRFGRTLPVASSGSPHWPKSGSPSRSPGASCRTGSSSRRFASVEQRCPSWVVVADPEASITDLKLGSTYESSRNRRAIRLTCPMVFCRCSFTEGLYPRGCEAGGGPDGGPGLLGMVGAVRTGLMDGLRTRPLAEVIWKIYEVLSPAKPSLTARLWISFNFS